MSGNCFLKQEATEEIISNVANFCSVCYGKIEKNQVIFYDMHNYCYLCFSCQEKRQATLSKRCDSLTDSDSSLFN